MDNIKDTFELSFEKVLKTIKSCKNYNHVNSCELLLNNFKLMFENKIEDDNLDETCLFLETQFQSVKDKFICD